VILAIVRHGKAERDGPDGTDASRTLTGRGVRQAEWLGAALAAHPAMRGKVVLVSSPIVRARMTAASISAALRVPFSFDERLATERSVRDCIEVIDDTAVEHAPDVLVIVGHNPHFEALAGALLFPGADGASAFREMRTGECCVMEVDTPARRSSARLMEWIRMEGE
jgi:phosphohistidine phosphatase SixA